MLPSTSSLTLAATNDRSRFRFVAVLSLVGLVLVLGACGTGSATESTLVTNEPLIEPTPVATTAPLSLPADDPTLPALAPLPATISAPIVSVAPVEEADLSVTVSPTTESPTTESPTTESPTAESPTTESSTTESSTTESPTAVGVEANASDGAPPVALLSTSEWSDCLVEAAERVDAVALLDPIAAGTSVDLSSVQLNALAGAAVDCDVVATSLADTDLATHLPTAAACVNAWLGSSGAGSVFVGLQSIARGQVTPTWAQGHLVEALDGCFTGASFAADVLGDVATNSSLVGAFDASCLASSFDASGTMRTYAAQLAADPLVATLFVSLSDQWVLSCANVGQMVAAAAAADGVALSTSSVSCIDAELKNSGLVAQLVAGTADTDTVGIATLACLTSAESAALFG